MSNKIPELLRDAKQRAAAILTEIDDLSGRGHLTPGQEERLERQVSAGERIHGEIEALEVAQTEMIREAHANGWVGAGAPGEPERDDGYSFNVVKTRDPWSDAPPAAQLARFGIRT